MHDIDKLRLLVGFALQKRADLGFKNCCKNRVTIWLRKLGSFKSAN